jgi:hypothetical protein
MITTKIQVFERDLAERFFHLWPTDGSLGAPWRAWIDLEGTRNGEESSSDLPA